MALRLHDRLLSVKSQVKSQIKSTLRNSTRVSRLKIYSMITSVCLLPEIFMVCLWPLPYKANAPWQYVCDGCQAFCSWMIHKQHTRFMDRPKTFFEKLTSAAIHHLPCKPICGLPGLTQPCSPVSNSCMVWRDG